MLHPPKAGLKATAHEPGAVEVARDVKRALQRLARPAGVFDAARHFRGTPDLILWVRRASAVGLIALVRKGLALDTAYRVAERLHPDGEDLIQKAVGWMLREAGKADQVRLERYLLARGPAIPRTTLRYAIERFDPRARRRLLVATRSADGR